MLIVWKLSSAANAVDVWEIQVWTNRIAARSRLMARLLRQCRIDLDHLAKTSSDGELRMIVNRCAQCSAEVSCRNWLANKSVRLPEFCPNVETFRRSVAR